MSASLFPDRSDRGSPAQPRSRHRSLWLGPVVAAAVLGVVLFYGVRLHVLRAGTEHRVASSDAAMQRTRPRIQAPRAPQPDSLAGVAPARHDQPIERLAALQKTREEREKLWDAEQAGIASCMEQRGFEYRRLQYDDGADLELARARIQPSDVATAGELGYGLVRDLDETARQQQEEKRHGAPYLTPGPSVSTAYREALVGPVLAPGETPPSSSWGSVELPGGGRISWYHDSCLARAREQVYGDDYAAMVLDLTISNLESDIEVELTNDAAYRAGLARWRTCMVGSGHAYTAPRAAASVLADAFHEGKLSMKELRKAEIDAATADSTCYRSAGLVELLAAARQRAEHVVLEREQDKAQAQRDALDDAVAKAKALLDN